MRVRKTNHRSGTVRVTRATHRIYPGRNHPTEPRTRDPYDDAVLVDRGECVDLDECIVEEDDGTWSYSCTTCRLTIIGWEARDLAEEQHAIHGRTPAHAALARHA